MAKLKFFLILLSLFLILILNYGIYIGKFNPLFILLWMTSLILFILPFVSEILPNIKPLKLSKNTFFITLVLLFPSIVRILSYQKYRFHQDDMISAYFSAKYDLASTNFFGAIPIDSRDWVSQFSAVYHYLQKIFFMIFGESLMSVKLSTIPYVIITSFFLYLTVKLLFNRRTAIVSLILYTFFPVSLYHETLGLHLNASTTVFAAFFFFLLLYLKNRKKIYSILTGISCSFCFLFYTSSFIALPIMILFLSLDFLIRRERYIFVNLILTIFTFLLSFSPFLTYMYQTKNYYPVQRLSYSNLLTGKSSDFKERIKKGESVIQIIKKNFTSTIKSIFIQGMRGHGGYNFGERLAFFEKTSLIFFLLGGFLSFLSLLFLKSRVELFVTYIVVVSTFLGVVFTNMPPAFHRLLVAVPSLVILSSVPFYFLHLIFKKNDLMWIFVTILTLGIYSLSNYNYFLKSTELEKDKPEFKMGYYITNNYPDRKVYVAAYTTHALQKIFYFFESKNMKKAEVDYHDSLLERFNPSEKYVYAIIFPDSFNKIFEEKDKRGRIINFSQDYSLFVN
ncbi:hypothetical protein A3B40_05115 [Candidatus Roizmanbacteria bacterium RIFCSPLOWO2_01_FULL_37_16]|uniref:Glycosyltransferase RgtA/B/C/D-like domain-containing protein n=1 Tax=Candidatus Roizmanbacteria bacterium RIFCSPLOWO2_01_FULL_37_16 TaxID=1802058 RepID=A0A1F7IMW8_9BACT|nr:MAG: hypothetical protein A2859_01260 [Candidatus Roizmanbacteria bacterium RIFCSPHIGHO2_01_FULL_37_16b]OGK33087.1 MAG: hypothetical protein A3F57_05945 [Candidatus Roizmanbacteria bacterium RIFCSPHIGHO2_12_FULL_36_11]OGK44736.1 MAG: hypothetical protein A3B40_05115 [Candidatus Roizmanbacteria bacterium RIFCSPLOWO2_01_FULL_37_16]